MPLATDDVIIPSGSYMPTIARAGAVAQSVTVQTGGILTIAAVGTLSIDGSTTEGINNSGTVNNNGRITIGATAAVGNYGILNAGVFNNSNACTSVIKIVSDNIIFNSGTFNNASIIIENATGNSNISSNTGLVQNLNGGSFTIGSGNAAFTTAGFIWTGCTNTDWNTASNWYPAIPLSTDNITIPDVTNDPSVSSLNIASGAILSILTGAAMNITGGGTYGIQNNGTVNNNGTINIGATTSVGTYGIYNQATFNNNVGGTINIDNATSMGIYNFTGGTFTNAATLTIGATTSAGYYGIYSRAIFNNNTGGVIKIDRVANSGITNYAGGTFTNAATLTIGAISSVGIYGIYNYSLFNNNVGGTIKIDNTTERGIYNIGLLGNAATLTIGGTTSVGMYGIYNRALFNNNDGGIINVDKATDMGVLNLQGTFTNAAALTLGATSSVGNIGLKNTATFNNNTGGTIKIDKSAAIGLLNNEVGTVFTNNAALIIGATSSVGSFCIINEASFTNNVGGTIKIDNALTAGIYNSTGSTFTNTAALTIGATASVGTIGIDNRTTFDNNACTSVLKLVSNCIISNAIGGTFSNAGNIIENASGISNISSNTGMVQNLNGGTFTIGSGNAPITSVGFFWTGCTSTDWQTTSNWITGTLPLTTDDVTILNGTNQPTISAAGAVAKSVTVNNSTVLTIAAAGTLSINGSATQGILNNGTVSNSSSLTIGGTTSVGYYGIYNTANFNNNTGGTITIDRASRNGIYNYPGTFTNAAVINLGVNSSIGDYGIYNVGTFNNNTDGSISIERTTQYGIHNYPGTFNNAATITMGAVTPVGDYGISNFGGSFYNNTGGLVNIDHTRFAGIYTHYSGIFTNAAAINIGTSASVGNYGIDNESPFNNNTGGIIKIDRTTTAGIYNHTTGGTFTNAATINIGSIATVGTSGLLNQNIFYNNAGSILTIDRSDYGINNAVGTFNNAATIHIGAIGSVSTGIYNSTAFNSNTGSILTINNVITGISNNATFNSNTGSILTIDNATTAGIRNNSPNTFNNYATLTIGRIASVGTYGIKNDGDFNNHVGGNITIDRCSYGIYHSGFGQTFRNDASITIGELAPMTELIDVVGYFYNNGIMKGSGLIHHMAVGFYLNGTLSPGYSPGKMTFDFNTNFSRTTLAMEVNGKTTAGTDFDQIVVTGTATLGGTLALTMGYTPTNGDQVNLVSATSISDVFSTITGLPPGWDISYTATEVLLTYTAVLPIELLDFSGKHTEGGNLLTWTTANELNNKGFQIERLMDNGQWITLGFVPTKGKTATYDFTDNQPLSTSYYRLRQIDNDGKETLSKVISIQSTPSGGKGGLKVYPSVTSHFLTVETSVKGDYQIINLLGQYIMGGALIPQIDVSAFTAGTYILKVGDEQEKFVKQ